MDRTKEIELLSQNLELARGKQPFMNEDETLIPVAHYVDEDFELAEQIQRGMRTGANEYFRFAKFEGALTQWHRRLKEKLGR